MNSFWKNIVGTLIAAGIVANVAVLFQFNARLASIETILKMKVVNQSPAVEIAKQ